MAQASIYETPNWDDLKARADERMAQVDVQSPEVRALIHEFNTNAVVMACQAGCQTPDAVRAYLRQMQKLQGRV